MMRAGPRDVELTDRVHPTQKPVAVLEAILRDFSAAGDAICDPYVGSGSTVIACERTDRTCYAVEIEPRYCDVIIQRWEAYTGAKAELLE
jgi:DNA modification methylase